MGAVMLAVAIAAACSRARSYGTIYTIKLLRRGADLDKTGPWRAFSDLTAAGVMRPLPAPLDVSLHPDRNPQNPASHLRRCLVTGSLRSPWAPTHLQ